MVFDMKNFKALKFGYTLLSGILVLAGISAVFYVGAYMNKGHPPASGIYALIVVLVVTPLSVLSLIAAFIGANDYSGRRLGIYFVFLGINIFYLFCIGQVWFYKAILGKPI